MYFSIREHGNEGSRVHFARQLSLLGLYKDVIEFEKSLDDAAQIHTTAWSARWMPVSLYQAGGSLTVMFNKHDVYMSSDINKSNL